MSWEKFPKTGRGRTPSEFNTGDRNNYGYVPPRKHPRSDGYQSSRPAQMPKWLSRQSSMNHSDAPIQRPSIHPSSYPHQPINAFQRNSEPTSQRGGSAKWHSRVYVGNLPSLWKLPNDAYKELFTALYVTAFGSLRVGEVTPVDSFWMHKCGMYGFLQMRGPKEAVNVMVFSGLILHGKRLTLSRPTGYRPDLKNLNADEYVPEHVNGDRMKALVQAMGGIISTPTERAYLMATQQVKYSNLRESDRQTGSTCSDDEHQSIENARPDKVVKAGKKTGLSQKASGKVVVLVDIVKTFDLEDKTQYEELLLDVGEECSSFGDVKNVAIPRKGEWMGSVFVEFATTQDARNTVNGMRKRGFENKAIEAYVVDNCDTVAQAFKRICLKSLRENLNNDR